MVQLLRLMVHDAVLPNEITKRSLEDALGVSQVEELRRELRFSFCEVEHRRAFFFGAKGKVKTVATNRRAGLQKELQSVNSICFKRLDRF